MHIFVTTGTGPVRIPEFRVALMAIFAAQRLVGGKQRKIGPIVIEMIGINARYVLLTTLMVSMTTATVDWPCSSHASMEPAFGFDIRCDFFMAIHAKWCLIGLVETHVAFVAVALELGMALGQLAG